MKPPRRLSIALGGGSSKGFVHIGVLSAMLETGARPELLVGVSAGAIVAAVFAVTRQRVRGRWRDEAAALREALVETMADAPVDTFDDWSILRPGGNALLDWLEDVCIGRTCGALPDFCATAVDAEQPGTDIWFHASRTPEVRLADAARASASLPILYRPHAFLYGSWPHPVRHYDGGLGGSVRPSVARALRPDLPCLAVSLSGIPRRAPMPAGWRRVARAVYGIRQSIDHLFWSLNRMEGRLVSEIDQRAGDAIVQPDTLGIPATQMQLTDAQRDALLENGVYAGLVGLLRMRLITSEDAEAALKRLGYADNRDALEQIAREGAI